MIYIDIDTNPKPTRLYPTNTFHLHPDAESFSLREFAESVECWTHNEELAGMSIEQDLRDNFLEWIQLNCTELDPKAVVFCSQHFVTHFSNQYVNSYKTISNLCKIEKELNIICTEDLKKIGSDWNCAAINLFATLNAALNNKCEVKFVEFSIGVLNNIAQQGFQYLPYELLYQSHLDSFNNKDFMMRISKADSIVCSLTGRFLEPSEALSISVVAKSKIYNSESIGAVLQLQSSVKSSAFIEWRPVLGVEKIVNMFEKKFFQTIFFQLINIFAEAEKFTCIALANESKTRVVYAEEIVDFEHIGILSSAMKLGIPIYATQHSLNPLVRYMSNDNANSLLPSKVFYNNKAALSIYRGSFEKSISLVKSRSYKDRLRDNVINDVVHRRILIIENDYFRNFSNVYDIPQMINEIVSFIQGTRRSGVREYIWRQRSSDFSPILTVLKDYFPSLIFTSGHGWPLSKIREVSSIAVGFGATSSMALEYIASGGIYFFASRIDPKNEYVPGILEFYQRSVTGSLSVASKISLMVDDSADFLQERSKQINIYNDIWVD